MMGGNPSWWSMQSELRSTSDHIHHNNHPHEEVTNNNLFISQTHPSNNNSMLPTHVHHQFLHDHHHHAQEFPHHSWSQLLLGGMSNEQEEERFSHFQTSMIRDVKSEVNSQSNNNNINNNNININNSNLYGNQYHHEDHNQQESSLGTTSSWTQLMPTSSPKSCVTTLNNNNKTNDNDNISKNNNYNNDNDSMLDFSTNKRSLQSENHQHVDYTTSECNSNVIGSVPKKPRVQPSSNPPLKVRKEKLGDRITSLHQLVSPFGKTDTASVLLEAIGYIRFLQGQIEALSSPYLGSNNASIKNSHSIHGERNCLFPDHPGQLLNDSCMKRREATDQEV
ncbi:hypothetical protein RND81_14G160400 [Saponaria officinalis]|uniref:BHLH domain-containing protein n=1 Tax=Saponaria officinalis TaxID=3572 RepID=A0AAW1GYG8_SAPOF